MIEEKITGDKKNMIWKRKRLIGDPMIDVERISGIYPDKDKAGLYFMVARYRRKSKMKSGKGGRRYGENIGQTSRY